jgi:peroxiredoxin
MSSRANLGPGPFVTADPTPTLPPHTAPASDGLGEQLERRKGELDVAYRASMDEALAHLSSSGVASRARRASDRAPDFALPGRRGETVVLSDLLRRGPVVLSFFRGEWCSFCRIEIDALVDALPAFRARGAALVMISPQETGAGFARFDSEPGLSVVHDRWNGVGLDYGLIFRMPEVLRRALLALGVDLSQIYGTDSWILPIPATYVVRTDGIIDHAHIDPDFTNRLEPSAIIDRLDRLARG